MNKLFALCLSLLFFISNALSEKVTVNVNGMTCGGCAESIIENFKAKPEVENVTVSLKEKKVNISFKEGKSLVDPEINKTIDSLGYEVAGIERTQ